MMASYNLSAVASERGPDEIVDGGFVGPAVSARACVESCRTFDLADATAGLCDWADDPGECLVVLPWAAAGAPSFAIDRDLRGRDRGCEGDGRGTGVWEIMDDRRGFFCFVGKASVRGSACKETG